MSTISSNSFDASNEIANLVLKVMIKAAVKPSNSTVKNSLSVATCTGTQPQVAFMSCSGRLNSAFTAVSALQYEPNGCRQPYLFV